MPSSNPTINPTNLRYALLGGIALFFCALYYPTVAHIASICWTDDDYSHGLLLPLISAYLLFTERKKLSVALPSAAPSLSLFAALMLLAGILLFLFGFIAQSLYLRWISMFISFVGISSLLLGLRFTRIVAPMILINIMAKPIPDSLVPRLFGPFQSFAAKVSAWTLEQLNVPVYLSGNIIEIPGMRLLVEEACSGMRSLISILTVAVIVLCVIAMPLIRKFVFVLAAILIAIVLNVFRVAATGVLAHFYDKDSATGFFHTFSGLVVFVVGLALLYGVGILLSKGTRSSA